MCRKCRWKMLSVSFSASDMKVTSPRRLRSWKPRNSASAPSSIMRASDRIILCALLVFLAVSCHANREPRSAEQSKEELLKLENRWLEVQDDQGGLDDICSPV